MSEVWSKWGVVDPTHEKENAPYKVIKWLKLPPQLFCFLIAKWRVWIRGEVAFDLLLPYLWWKGPSGSGLLCWHLNPRECHKDHSAGVAFKKLVEFDSFLGSNRCSRSVRQRSTGQRSTLLRALFSERIWSLFISVMVVETRQIPMSF